MSRQPRRSELLRLVDEWLEKSADELQKGRHDSGHAYWDAAFSLALHLNQTDTRLSDAPAWDWLAFIAWAEGVPRPASFTWVSS